MEWNVQDAGVSIKGLLCTVSMVNILQGKENRWQIPSHLTLETALMISGFPLFLPHPSHFLSSHPVFLFLPFRLLLHHPLYFLNFQANYPLMLSFFFFLNWLLKIRKPQRACPGDSRWAVTEKAQSFGTIRYLYTGALYSLLQWWNLASCFMEEFYDLLTANSS